mgnify:CR=1 FL=1
MLRALSGGMPEGARPYAILAEQAGTTEAEAVRAVRGLLDRGVIRELAAIPDWRLMGYGIEALVVWQVPAAHLEQAGLAAARRSEAALVCSRRTGPEWPCNLYVTLRARSRRELETLVEELSADVGVEAHAVLPALREFAGRAPCHSELADGGEEATRELHCEAELTAVGRGG